MLTKSEKILYQIKLIREELYYPTKMNLRFVTQSEMAQFDLVPFPNSDFPAIGSFLKIEWLAILDYNGLTIQPLNDSTSQGRYIVPYHAKSSQELATVVAHTLDDLTRLTSDEQLFAFDFLKQHKFVKD